MLGQHSERRGLNDKWFYDRSVDHSMSHLTCMMDYCGFDGAQSKRGHNKDCITIHNVSLGNE